MFLIWIQELHRSWAPDFIKPGFSSPPSPEFSMNGTKEDHSSEGMTNVSDGKGDEKSDSNYGTGENARASALEHSANNDPFIGDSPHKDPNDSPQLPKSTVGTTPITEHTRGGLISLAESWGSDPIELNDIIFKVGAHPRNKRKAHPNSPPISSRAGIK
ncbi:hypothetical protein L1987_43226 [Smallanthus sonchifolius]|uniref:Uncharacterized protein n=1 Tax=Smallanthus sonchifolius TaxID=185202 RepID=A0ACB9GKV0_9ASTR|nr:hypothetical protein L1987_43226 [Smallanthus sonchifolius]